jgi:hypothetical protein
MTKFVLALLCVVALTSSSSAQQKPGYDNYTYSGGLTYENYSYGDKPQYDDAIHGGRFEYLGGDYFKPPKISDRYFAPIPAEPPTSGCKKPECIK